MAFGEGGAGNFSDSGGYGNFNQGGGGFQAGGSLNSGSAHPTGNWNQSLAGIMGGGYGLLSGGYNPATGTGVGTPNNPNANIQSLMYQGIPRPKPPVPPKVNPVTGQPWTAAQYQDWIQGTGGLVGYPPGQLPGSDGSPPPTGDAYGMSGNVGWGGWGGPQGGPFGQTTGHPIGSGGTMSPNQTPGGLTGSMGMGNVPGPNGPGPSGNVGQGGFANMSMMAPATLPPAGGQPQLGGMQPDQMRTMFDLMRMHRQQGQPQQGPQGQRLTDYMAQQQGGQPMPRPMPPQQGPGTMLPPQGGPGMPQGAGQWGFGGSGLGVRGILPQLQQRMGQMPPQGFAATQNPQAGVMY